MAGGSGAESAPCFKGICRRMYALFCRSTADQHRLLKAFVDMLNMCALIRQSMYACRRIQPLPIDFEYAFRATSIRFDSLMLELENKDDPPQSPLLPTPPPEKAHQTSQTFLDDDFNTLADQQPLKYVPSTFPPLPSRHTYRHTSVYTDRERDPRRIRELATEEGRLGEEALRKLVGAVRTEARLDVDDKGKAPERGSERSQKTETMESMFEKTMQAVMLTEAEAHIDQGENDGRGMKLELAPTVNCERKYWMPESMLKLKREAEKVAERAAERAEEKRKEDLRAARQEKLAAEGSGRAGRSRSTKAASSRTQPTNKKALQRSSSGPLKLKIRMKPQSSDASVGNV